MRWTVRYPEMNQVKYSKRFAFFPVELDGKPETWAWFEFYLKRYKTTGNYRWWNDANFPIEHPTTDATKEIKYV